jgi:hypothetical protein
MVKGEKSNILKITCPTAAETEIDLNSIHRFLT